METTPFLLVGDGPQEATGLGRIARDIGALLAAEIPAIDLLQVGGPVPPVWTTWPHVPMGAAERGDDWGASFVEAIWRDRWGHAPGILMLVWDPSRCYAYLDTGLDVQRWCYTAIDSYNRWGGIGGPAGDALRRFDRVLAYGRWASQIVQRVRGGSIAYLPHGIWPHLYTDATDEERAAVREQLGPRLGKDAILIGCVATNQPRK